MNVLYVENNVEMAQGVKKTLERLGIDGDSLHVEYALSCKAARMKLAGRPKFDVLVQDIYMNSGDRERFRSGHDVQAFDVIREAHKKGLPCIVLSNLADPDEFLDPKSAKAAEQEVLNRTGAEAFLSKGDYVQTSGRALVAKIKHVLGIP